MPAAKFRPVLPKTTTTHDYVVVLSELRFGGASVVGPDTFFTDNPVYAVRLNIADPQFTMSTRSDNYGNPELIWAAGLPVQTAEDGQRIANAITHAATLCGANDRSAF